MSSDCAFEASACCVLAADAARVAGLHGDRLRIQLAAPPVDGAANAELIDLLARLLSVPRASVTIVRGQTSKRKTIRVAPADIDLLTGKLARD